MDESKIELTDRLRHEGRWAEASLFKDAKVKELRAGGMTGATAKEEAWRLMAQKYPPLPKPAPAPMPPPQAVATSAGASAVVAVATENGQVDDAAIGRLSELIRDTIGWWSSECHISIPADASQQLHDAIIEDVVHGPWWW